MKKNEKLGYKNLVKKSLAALAASLGALTGSQSEAAMSVPDFNQDNDKMSYDSFQKNVLKPKLILKLNIDNPEGSILTMHTSHRSHSSHRSHRSHSSHYSSSTYTPSKSTTTTPSSPSYTSPKPKTTTTTSSSPSYSPVNRSNDIPLNYSLEKERKSLLDATWYDPWPDSQTYAEIGPRVLYKGCEGKDVEELQQLLIFLKYDIPTTGYFGDQTEKAVIQFQKDHELKPDGKVDEKTVKALLDVFFR